MQADRPFIGILLMLGFCVLAPLGDSIGKILSQEIGIGQLLLARFAVQAAILIPFVFYFSHNLKLPTGTLWLTLCRTALHIIGIGLMFTSLRYLPLADAVAIAFVMPFIMLILGKYVLNEEIGTHRMMACLIGFVGTLLVIQPNFAEVGWPALLPLGVALDFALFMLVTRKIAKQIDAIKLQAVSGLQAMALMVPILLLFPSLPETQITPGDTRIWLLLLTLGLIGTSAHLLMTWSLRFAPAATLAPMQYLEIPFSALIGWIIFHDLPNGLAAIGIIITMTAGLYIILRERRLSRHPTPIAEA